MRVRPPGIIARNERIADDEITFIDGIPVTTVARTALDLGRHQSRGQAIARLDALMRAAPFSSEEVLLLAKRYRGARGVKRLKGGHADSSMAERPRHGKRGCGCST